jgi:hypothetical protein
VAGEALAEETATPRRRAEHRVNGLQPRSLIRVEVLCALM